MSAFPADDRRRAASALARIRATMIPDHLSPFGDWWPLATLADLGECSETAASARVRDLRKEGFAVERKEVAPGLWHYRVWGRAPLEPAKKKPRDSELDALRARIERLEAELAALSTTTPTGPRLRGTAGGGGAVRLSTEEGQ